MTIDNVDMTDSNEPGWALNADLRRARRDRDTAFLVSALSHPIEGHLAAMYLGQIEDPAAVPALLPVLDSPSAPMRTNAARSLGQLNAFSAVPKLVDLGLSDDDVEVRTWAIDSVAKLAGPSGVPALATAISDPSWRVRRSAAIGLGWLGSENHLRAIQSARLHDFWPGSSLYQKAARQIRKRSR